MSCILPRAAAAWACILSRVGKFVLFSAICVCVCVCVLRFLFLRFGGLMPRLHYTTIVQERSVSADAVEVFDLGTNPLSLLNIVIRPLNETSTLANYARYLELVGAFNSIRVLYKGQSVISASGRDLAALNYARSGIVPREANPDNLDNSRRCCSLPILLGRFPYDPSSAFPRTNRGDLTIELDIDVADTGYDNFKYSIESVEILDAHPSEYERKVTIAKTFNAVGNQDTPLPVGNALRGLLLFGTTGARGATPAPSWGSMQLLLNNQQHTVASMEWESSMLYANLLGRQPPNQDAHQHSMEPVAGIETTQHFEVGSGGWEQYSYVDLDPTRNDMYSIQTAGASQFLLRCQAETADAVRLIPVERIAV